MTFDIYLNSGVKITIVGVASFTINRTSDCKITGYKISWNPGKQPKMFHIDPAQIDAVICQETD